MFRGRWIFAVSVRRGNRPDCTMQNEKEDRTRIKGLKSREKDLPFNLLIKRSPRYAKICCFFFDFPCRAMQSALFLFIGYARSRRNLTTAKFEAPNTYNESSPGITFRVCLNIEGSQKLNSAHWSCYSQIKEG